MVNKCPHCGSKTERPIFFSLTTQRIFDFIWNNPNCSKLEIEQAIYGKVLVSNVVNVHISKIRNRLRDTTYRLIRVSGGKYSIVDAGYANLEVTSNASV